MSTPPLLDVALISKSFRGLVAVNRVSLSVGPGEIVGLIGPNGAGKTTIFNLIAGVFAPDQGDIAFDGAAIAGKRPDQVCHAGIGRTFQLVKPFYGLTVEDNVVIGALKSTRDVAAARAASLDLLERFGLADRRHDPAGSLTLPGRKRLEVARAMATRPRLLLLDEVMAGLRPGETDELVEVFRALNRESGLAILMIEHVMRAVMALSQHVIVLNYGEKIAEGAPEAVVRDPRVLECYLGEDAF